MQHSDRRTRYSISSKKKRNFSSKGQISQPFFIPTHDTTLYIALNSEKYYSFANVNQKKVHSYSGNSLQSGGVFYYLKTLLNSWYLFIFKLYCIPASIVFLSELTSVRGQFPMAFSFLSHVSKYLSLYLAHKCPFYVDLWRDSSVS
jgi:hypothetical protein